MFYWFICQHKSPKIHQTSITNLLYVDAAYAAAYVAYNILWFLVYKSHHDPLWSCIMQWSIIYITTIKEANVTEVGRAGT